jgi:hypothetical protein
MKYTFNNEEWKKIVAHVWSFAYLLKTYGAHFRKFAKVLSKALTGSPSDWTGKDVWGSPIVSLAPPISFYTKPNVVIANRCRNETSTEIRSSLCNRQNNC